MEVFQVDFRRELAGALRTLLSGSWNEGSTP